MARLLVIGSSNTDMTVRLPALPGPGETVLGGSFLSGAGGKGANQAVAAARLGAEVVFVAAVGDDAAGRRSLEGYRAEGLDVSHVKVIRGVASGVALIFVGEAGGENMIGVAAGANALLDPGAVAELPESLFTRDRVLLVGGLEVPLPTVAAAVRRASAAGMRVVLNPAPVTDLGGLSDILARVDVLTPNRGELAALSGLPTETIADVAEATGRLLGRGPGAVVVTLGAEGCLIVDPTGSRTIPAFRVKAVDTVGAGDAFSAALAVALADGQTLDDAARRAAASAAVAVTQPGAQGSLPARLDVDRLLASSQPSRSQPHAPPV